MSKRTRKQKDLTRLAHAGREPARQHGFVNTPIYRGSTVLFPTVEALEANAQDFTYGRLGTPTVRALEEAIAELEGGHRTLLTPSGLSAIATSLLAFLAAGDEVLVVGQRLSPDAALLRQRAEAARRQDHLLRPADRRRHRQAHHQEDEGRVHRVARLADLRGAGHSGHRQGARMQAGAVVILDNTWATPLYFKPFAHGADVSIQAATKYIGGHADVMLGAITMNEKTAAAVAKTHEDLGLCAGPEDVYLGLRGLRSLGVRLARHQQSALEMARWLAERPEVARVIHPALPSDPGHAIWKRDFTGASGLFSIVLKPVAHERLAAMLDGLSLFGMGYSWGGFESLILPFDPRDYRSATQWQAEGPALRLHIGLEDVDDLKADLDAGFARLTARD